MLRSTGIPNTYILALPRMLAGERIGVEFGSDDMPTLFARCATLRLVTIEARVPARCAGQCWLIEHARHCYVPGEIRRQLVEHCSYKRKRQLDVQPPRVSRRHLDDDRAIVLNPYVGVVVVELDGKRACR